MGRAFTFLFRRSNSSAPLIATVETLLAHPNRSPSWLRVGSVLLHEQAQYTAEVAVYPKGTGKRSRHRTTQRTIAYDMGLYITLLWNLVECVAEQWHMLEVDAFATALGERDLDAITCAGVSRRQAEEIDNALGSLESYVGVFEIDLGNPVQLSVFVDYLIPVASVSKDLLVVPEIAPDDHAAPWWATQIAVPNLKIQEEHQFRADAVVSYPRELSERGKITANLARGKRSRRTSELLLQKASAAMGSGADLTRDVRIGLPDKDVLEDTLVEEAKMLKYILSPDHEKGKHKARVFKSALGLTAKNWRYLAAQLVRGLPKAEIKETKISEFGAHHTADIAVIGIDDRKAVVRTAWIALGNDRPRLVTAYVLSGSPEASTQPELPPVQLEAPTSAADWETVFRFAAEAGRQAAAATVPTPMKISDGELIAEGACGDASVVLPDARTPFARWAKTTGKGYPHYRKGWVFGAEVATQSVDRARAYAQEFARVLALNGIESRVEWRLD